jgi:hypothetical protein
MGAAMCGARLSTAASDLRRNTRNIYLAGIAVGMWEQRMVRGQSEPVAAGDVPSVCLVC